MKKSSFTSFSKARISGGSCSGSRIVWRSCSANSALVILPAFLPARSSFTPFGFLSVSQPSFRYLTLRLVATLRTYPIAIRQWTFALHQVQSPGSPALVANEPRSDFLLDHSVSKRRGVPVRYPKLLQFQF